MNTKPCEMCGCPYPNDHTLDCPILFGERNPTSDIPFQSNETDDNLGGSKELRQVRDTSEGGESPTCCGSENRHEEHAPAQKYLNRDGVFRVGSMSVAPVLAEPTIENPTTEDSRTGKARESTETQTPCIVADSRGDTQNLSLDSKIDFSRSTFSSQDDGDKRGMAATVEEGTAPKPVQVNADASVGRSNSGNIKYDAPLSLDKTEATCAWYDRPDWDKPGNGGANDWMFEDREDE